MFMLSYLVGYLDWARIAGIAATTQQTIATRSLTILSVVNFFYRAQVENVQHEVFDDQLLFESERSAVIYVHGSHKRVGGNNLPSGHVIHIVSVPIEPNRRCFAGNRLPSERNITLYGVTLRDVPRRNLNLRRRIFYFSFQRSSSTLGGR